VARKSRRSNRRRIAEPYTGHGRRLKAPISPDIPDNQLPPIFSLQYMDTGKYGLNKCTPDEKAQFVDVLYRLSQLTWNTIQSTSKRGLGHEKIPRTILRASIPKHVTQDVTLIAFRFSGKRMVGYRQRRTFYVLWLDLDLSLYDHVKLNMQDLTLL
jgi:hypothetical protein